MFDLNYQEQKRASASLPKPFTFLDLDRLDKNIELSLLRAGRKKIRVATKSIRSVEVLNYIKLKLGERFSGLMTYSIDESLDLLSAGFDYCLVGYPQILTLNQVNRWKELNSLNKKLVFMIDSLNHVEKLTDLGRKHQISFDVCIDIDLSLRLPRLNFGVFRSSIISLTHLEELILSLKKSEFVNCIGLMGYEAQVAGVPDLSGKGVFFDLVISYLKKLSRKKILNCRQGVLTRLSEEFSLDFINGGGTGSLSFTASDDSVTEITVGSAFYAPHLFDGYRESFFPSLGFAIEVSRRPTADMITCHGGGYVASGACDINKLPKVFSPSGLIPQKNEMFGEVQTPFLDRSSESLDIGDPIFLRFAKAGELLERFSDIVLFRKNQVVGRWKTYRGEGKCYL